MLWGTCYYYYHPWNGNKERFSDLTKSDPTDCSWQSVGSSRLHAPGAASAGQCSVGLASLDLRQGRRAGLLESSESLFPPVPFPFCLIASSSNFVLSFLPVFPKLCKKSHLCFSLDPQSWVRAPPPETFHPLHLSPTTRNALWHDCWVTLSLEFLADKSLILLARFATQKPCQWRASTSWVFTLWLFRKQQAFAMPL